MASVLNSSLIPNNEESEPLFVFGWSFTPQGISAWTASRWDIPLISVALYLVTIFGLQKYMESRKPFDLRLLLVLWNIYLACYSVFCAAKATVEISRSLRESGFHATTCDNRYIRANTMNAFYSWLFLWSKFVEFGDTLFIVLRKKRLIFLHWYHHVTVLLLSWFSFAEFASTIQWYGPINASAHAIMYTYYAFQAMKFRVPRAISMFVTSYQIAQMFFGSFITFYAYKMRINGYACAVSDKVLLIAGLIYLSYIYLFVRFFYFAYIHNERRKPSTSEKTTKVQ